MHHDKEKGTYTIRDQDFEFIKKWVDNIRSGVETGEIAVAPKKKVAAKSGGRKRKRAKIKEDDSREESGENSGDEAAMVVEEKSLHSVSSRGRIRKRKKLAGDFGVLLDVYFIVLPLLYRILCSFVHNAIKCSYNVVYC